MENYNKDEALKYLVKNRTDFEWGSGFDEARAPDFERVIE